MGGCGRALLSEKTSSDARSPAVALVDADELVLVVDGLKTGHVLCEPHRHGELHASVWIESVKVVKNRELSAVTTEASYSQGEWSVALLDSDGRVVLERFRMLKKKRGKERLREAAGGSSNRLPLARFAACLYSLSEQARLRAYLFVPRRSNLRLIRLTLS